MLDDDTMLDDDLMLEECNAEERDLRMALGARLVVATTAILLLVIV